MAEVIKKPWFERFSWLSNTTLIIAIIALVGSVASAIGHALGLWSFRPAILVFALAGLAGLLGAFIGIVATIAAKRRGEGLVKTGVALLICLVFAGNFLNYLSAGAAVPPIHDVTTNLDDIPQFATLNPDNPNPENWRELHSQAYGSLATTSLPITQTEALTKARAVAEQLGFENITLDEAAGTLEATAVSSWFEFEDDIIVRIRANGDAVDVDMRSVSRVGISDLGANAKRIKAFMAELSK